MIIQQKKCHFCKSLASLLCKNNYYNCYFCNFCKTVFLSPLPIQKDITQRYAGYNNLYIEFKEVMKKRSKRTSEEICTLLRKFNTTGQTLLEVGSGYGFFLDIAKRYFEDVSGIEPIKNLCEYARKELEITTVNNTYQTYFKKNPNKKFDVIVLIHVIEHVLDPREILMLAAKHLNKNGVLFLETPNVDSHLFEMEREAYTFLIPPEHIYLFSPTSFHHLLKDFPSLEIKKVTTYSLPEHFAGVIKRKIKRYLGKSETKKNNIAPHTDITEKPVEVSKHKSIVSSIKYLLFDKIFCGLFHETMSIGNKGSMLQVYIVKK